MKQIIADYLPAFAAGGIIGWLAEDIPTALAATLALIIAIALAHVVRASAAR